MKALKIFVGILEVILENPVPLIVIIWTAFSLIALKEERDKYGHNAVPGHIHTEHCVPR